MLSAHFGCRACELLFMEVVVFAARGLGKTETRVCWLGVVTFT
jgi:hypothetical protein